MAAQSLLIHLLAAENINRKEPSFSVAALLSENAIRRQTAFVMAFPAFAARRHR